MSHSPYRHMDTRNVARLDLILLDGLYHCTDAASTDAVIEISDPRGFAQLDRERVVFELTLMMADGYVERVAPFGQDQLRWKITEKGRAHIVATETRNVIDEVARHTPIRPAKSKAAKPVDKLSIEEVPEVDLTARLRASHHRLDRDGVPPAQPKPSFATVCIDEAELDDWWSSLNVQAKAELFTERSLLYSDREIATARADIRIPVLGTIGDTATSTIGQVVATRISDPFQVGGAQ